MRWTGIMMYLCQGVSAADHHLARSVRTTYCVNTCINLELMCYKGIQRDRSKILEDHV